MFENIVFFSNWASIWFLLIIIPFFIFFLLRLKKANRENETLRKDIYNSYGKSTAGEYLIEPGKKYEFKSGFGFGTHWVFILVIKDLKRVRFCHLTDPHKWVFDGRPGFAPEDNVVYIATDSDDDTIILNNENRSRH